MTAQNHPQARVLKATYTLQAALADAIDCHDDRADGLDLDDLRLAAAVVDHILTVPLESQLVRPPVMTQRRTARPRLALAS